MVKLLRSDFYRLFRSTSFYICTLVASVLAAGGAFIMEWSSRMVAEMQNDALMAQVSPLSSGIDYGILTFSGGDVHLFMAIFIAIFVTAEFAHGTMKNAVSKGCPRYQIYLSKMITMTAATYMMLVVMFVFSTISATILTGTLGTVSGTYLVQIFAMLGVELFLHAALTAVFVMIAVSVRNVGAVIAINIVGVISVGSLFYQLLELLFKNKIEFAHYGLRNNILLYYYNVAPPWEDILRAILVGIAFFAVTTALGIFAFKKTDVK